jgi:hypothetical protein
LLLLVGGADAPKKGDKHFGVAIFGNGEVE